MTGSWSISSKISIGEVNLFFDRTAVGYRRVFLTLDRYVLVGIVCNEPKEAADLGDHILSLGS